MKFGSLQVAWLVAFVESAEHKRTAAAGTLGVSQSTVTKYIESLECWYGGGPRRLLMLGNMHPASLTREGEDFLPKAKELLALLRAALPPPVVTDEAPVKPVFTSTAHIRVPPPVVSRQGDATPPGADGGRPVLAASTTTAQISISDDDRPSGKARDLPV